MFWFVVVLLFGYLTTFFYFNGFSNKKGEPVYTRGLIPWFGVMLQLRNGFYNFIVENAKKNGNISTIYLLGERIHLLTDPRAYQQIQKKPKIFSFYPIVFKMSTRIRPDKKNKKYDASAIKETTSNISKFLQGNYLQNLTKTYGKLLSQKMDDFFEENQENGEIEIGLHYFISKVLFNASSRSILGEDFNPDLVEKDYFLYDKDFKILAIGLPNMFFKYIFNARERVLDEIKKLDFSKSCEYVQVDSDKKTQEELANTAFSLLIASQTNSISGAFWTFYEIIKDRKLTNRVLDKISKDFSIENYEDHFDSMKLLNSILDESNRLHNIGLSMREALEDCKIEVDSKNYSIRKGDRIYMIPIVSRNEKLFKNATKFDPDRFLGDSQLENSLYQTPFGGGIHLCPGRFFAVNEIKIFVVLMLRRFTCEFLEDKEVENNYKGISYLAPKEDIKVKIKKIK